MLYLQLRKGRRNNLKKNYQNNTGILLVYTVCTHILTAITFLKLNNNYKCHIQINVNVRIQNPGKSDAQQYSTMALKDGLMDLGVMLWPPDRKSERKLF